MADDDIDNMDFDLPGVTPVAGSSSSQAQVGGMIPDSMGQVFDPSESPALQELSKRWFCLYPVYINAEKSSSEGRKIPKSAAVSKPTSVYMAEAVRQLGLKCAFEPNKRHPRDPFTFGRIRVELVLADGKPAVPLYPTKKKLLIQVAKMMDEVKVKLHESDPRLEAFAAASRSEMSKNVEELANTAVKEMKKEALGQTSQKKKKKK